MSETMFNWNSTTQDPKTAVGGWGFVVANRCDISGSSLSVSRCFVLARGRESRASQKTITTRELTEIKLQDMTQDRSFVCLISILGTRRLSRMLFPWTYCNLYVPSSFSWRTSAGHQNLNSFPDPNLASSFSPFVKRGCVIK